MENNSKTLQKYVRLLTYENACKVVNFINKNDRNDYANITVGGVSMLVSESNFNRIKHFIESLKVRFEITDIPPYKVEQQIVNDLKNLGVIEKKIKI